MITTKTIKELTLQELKLEAKIMADILNKRLRRLEKEGLESSSVFYSYVTRYAREGKEFIDYTKKGQVKYITGFKKYDRNEMIKIYKSMRNAMDATSSTVTGVKKINVKKLNTLKKLFDDVGDSLNDAEIQDINDLFKTARESGFLRTYGSDTVMKMASKGTTIDEVKQRMNQINDVSQKISRGQIPNRQVIKAMTLSQEEFNAWINEKEVSDYTRAVRRTASDVVLTDEQREFKQFSSKVRRNANSLTKEEAEVARISKRLKKNI